MKTQDTSFYIASTMARLKEQTLKAAINHYFNGEEWDETILEHYAGISVASDGTETFYIGETSLVRFAPLESKVDIEDGRVMLLFNQPILELY